MPLPLLTNTQQNRKPSKLSSMASTLHTLSLLLLLLLSLSSSLPSFSLSSSFPSSTILDAAEILSSTGFETMALNLELASQTLTTPQTLSLTVFAPTNFAFKKITHLPLSLLRYPLLPHAFSLQSLSSLPFGANIATLLPGHSLTITTAAADPHRISINNVTVNPLPVFDDGSLVIFGTDNFFDPYFRVPGKNPTRGDSSRSITCFPTGKNEGKWFSEEERYSFGEACGVMRSKGCSVMASLLDMQFLGLGERPQLTLFAPVDEVMVNHLVVNLSDYSSMLRRHLVPCKVLWSDLVSLEDGTAMWSYENGFTLNVTRSGSGSDMLLVNGVPVIFPELYYSDWLVVHGIRDVLSVYEGRVQGVAMDHGRESSSFGFNRYGEENPAAHYHFSVFH